MRVTCQVRCKDCQIKGRTCASCGSVYLEGRSAKRRLCWSCYQAQNHGPTSPHWRGGRTAKLRRRREKERAQRAADPVRDRLKRLRVKYGISPEEHERLFVQQRGVCAICLRSETAMDKRTGKARELAVDHDHTTGAVRGLLCSNCNNGIGLLAESPDILRRAAEYLEESGAERRVA
jgi:Recombination endonuclease VII